MQSTSSPDDIKARSLHTVVTKPVKRSEILVGRIMGVTLVGTLVVGVMSVVGYLWLIRALKSMGMDPALMSTPLIASLLDVFGIVLYFNVAPCTACDLPSFIYESADNLIQPPLARSCRRCADSASLWTSHQRGTRQKFHELFDIQIPRGAASWD